MRHMISAFQKGLLISPVFFSVLMAQISLLPIATPAVAEQLVALGQEKANTQSTDARANAKVLPTVRKPHKLIRKSPPPATALVEAPKTPSSSVGLGSGTISADSTTLQGATTTPLSQTSSTGVAPAKASTTTTTSLPIAGVLSSPTTSTSSTSTPLAGMATAGSSTSGSGAAGGRSMQRLTTAMPGLTQLISPTTSSVASPPSTPTIAQNPASISFSAVQNGANPASQSVTITNGGTGTLSWTATSTTAWLTINGGSAASGTNTGSFNVGANISGLSIGNHTGTITIGATGATNTPQSLSVTLSITAAPTPTIGLSATTLSFTGVQGGSNPSAQTLTINNTGAGTLNWSISENATWLTPNVLTGTGSGSVTLNVNTAGMAAGTYSTPITISATGATNTPQTVTVNLTLTAPQIPTINLVPTSLAFSATQGGSNPAAQIVNISNSGTGTLSWSASDTASWLSISPISGAAPGSLTVTANVAGLSAATYSASITVTGSGATNSPQSIPVTFTVSAPTPTLTVSPSSLTFSATQGAANPASQSLSITSNGSWSVSEAVSWLTVSPASGSNNGTVTVSVDTTTATVGTNSGTITITGGGITRTVAVALSLSAPTATLTVSPSSLTFTATQGAANPANQSLTVTSNTSWTASTIGSWLTVSPTSGSNNGTITVSVNTASATVGTNNGSITITGGGISRTITVTLTLNTSGSSSAILVWNASTGPNIASYRIYQSTTSGVYGAPIATVPASALSYTGTGLQVGNTYYFRVTAVDTSNNESLPSNEVSKSIF